MNFGKNCFEVLHWGKTNHRCQDNQQEKHIIFLFPNGNFKQLCQWQLQIGHSEFGDTIQIQ